MNAARLHAPECVQYWDTYLRTLEELFESDDDDPNGRYLKKNVFHGIHLIAQSQVLQVADNADLAVQARPRVSDPSPDVCSLVHLFLLLND